MQKKITLAFIVLGATLGLSAAQAASERADQLVRNALSLD